MNDKKDKDKTKRKSKYQYHSSSFLLSIPDSSNRVTTTKKYYFSGHESHTELPVHEQRLNSDRTNNNMQIDEINSVSLRGI